VAKSSQIKVGVIGCGGIAQMMHLPFLFAMSDRFQIAALSDISPGVLQAMGARFQVPAGACFTHYEDLVRLDLDAVLVLSGGDHFPQALAALQSGKHIFVEKPLCFTLKEADTLIDAAERAKVKLMVGYMKRYDPGYQYALARLPEMGAIRYAQINTLHPAETDYLRIHNIVRFDDVPPEVLKSIREADHQRVIEAIGDVPANLQALYPNMFLGSMVHDTNALRGLLGEPEGVLFSELWPPDSQPASINTVIKYPGDLRAVYTWTYLADLRDYFQEIALMSASNRLRIQFPSPYLRHFPTPVVFQGMEGEASYEKRVTVSYDEAFRRELEAFHDAIINDRQPLTGAADARRDIKLLQQILAALHPQGLGGEAAQ
jgi:predicted dehydrogenase